MVYFVGGLVVLLVIGGVWLLLPGRSSAPRGSSASGSSSAHLTGTMNDWSSAVCRTAPLPMGRGAALAAATSAMSCTGGMQTANGGRTTVPILIGTYQSESAMQGDVGGLGGYAAGNEGTEYVVFGTLATASAPAKQAESAMFQPLAKYGFTVHS